MNKIMNFVKKILLVFSIITFAFLIFACEKKNDSSVDEIQETTAVNLFDFEKNYKGKRVAVVYFSATGNTKMVAEKIAEIFDCDMIEIKPVEPYTERDLTSYDEDTRPMRENKYNPFMPQEYGPDDEIPEGTVTELPKIKSMNLNKYHIIFLGYPIWFNDAPRIIYSFIRDVHLTKRTIIPFCTSGSNDISPSDQNLANFAPDDIDFMSGARFTKDSTIDEIKEWATRISADLP